jgi:hypothetical protein
MVVKYARKYMTWKLENAKIASAIFIDSGFRNIQIQVPDPDLLLFFYWENI